MCHRDVCASELLCSSLAPRIDLYSMPRRWTPYTSYQSKRIEDMDMNGGRRRGEKAHIRASLPAVSTRPM